MMIVLFSFSFSDFTLQKLQPLEAKFPEEIGDSLIIKISRVVKSR